MPVTPTSQSRATGLPRVLAVTAASSATGGIRRTGARHQDGAYTTVRRRSADNDHPGGDVMGRAWKGCQEWLRHRGADAAGDHPAFGCAQPVYDVHDLIAGLALAEHDLWKASAQAAVVVQACKAKILVGKVTQAIERMLDARVPLLDTLQQTAQPGSLHE